MDNKNSWTKVKATDYYKAFYCASSFKAGDKIDVKWRDGSITTETLKASKGTSSEQIDMNSTPDVFPTQKLYIISKINGEKASINLKNREIRKHR